MWNNELRDGFLRVLCHKREYLRDDFELAMEATSNRPRCPFGIDPLRHAYLRAKSKPIVVLLPEIQDDLSKTVFSMAVHLQYLNPERSILLPIEQLRALLGCRKLMASGAVRKLLKHDILLEVGAKAHTGKAREFRLLAKEGVHYQLGIRVPAGPDPHL